MHLYGLTIQIIVNGSASYHYYFLNLLWELLTPRFLYLPLIFILSIEGIRGQKYYEKLSLNIYSIG